MPAPGSPDAPLFKGKYVTDFLDTLEALASSSHTPFNDLPRYVLRYCHRRVHYIIEPAPFWTQNDWPAARAYLIKLYGSSDRNLLFFRGIPRELQRTIRDQLPEVHTKVQSPPPIDDVLALLRNEFDVDDIFVEDDTDSASDFEESDLELPDAKCDQEVPIMTPWKSKKKVEYSANTCFTALPPPTTMFYAALPLKDTSFSHDEQVRDVEDLQATAQDDDSTDGDVDSRQVLDALISPSLQPATPKYPPEQATDGGLQQHDDSSTPNSLTHGDDSQKNLDNITTHYCLAVKVQVRRYPRILTGNIPERAEISLISSFKSLHTDDTFFRILFYTVPATPTRPLGVLSANRRIQQPHALTAECTFVATGHNRKRLYNDKNYSRKATYGENPNEDVKGLKNIDTLSPQPARSMSSILVGFSRLSLDALD